MLENEHNSKHLAEKYLWHRNFGFQFQMLLEADTDECCDRPGRCNVRRHPSAASLPAKMVECKGMRVLKFL